MINIPKGTKDILPADSFKWHFVEGLARDICRRFNIKEIRTPVFEHTELFVRSMGETSDVVGKEMYTFLDKGDRSITLKPEGTAPVARSYIENALESMSLPLKVYYFTPVFRYERPQAGRYREHHQFGVEIYGDKSPQMDAETIKIAHDFLKSAGLKNIELNINSIGCPACRAEYIKALKSYLSGREGTMCGTCKDRFLRNPLRILDCKVDSCKQIVAGAPRITDHLCADCAAHMQELQHGLKVLGIDYEINPWIVRGLDYYTRTVFEFVSSDLGAQGTVCGGGRYDNLVESLGGKPTPCVGFGLGLERLLMLVDAAGASIPPVHLDYFIIVQSADCLDYCIELTNALRAKGLSADTDYMGRSIKSQFKFAEKQGAESVIVVGGEEVATGNLTVKRLSDGQLSPISAAELIKQ